MFFALLICSDFVPFPTATNLEIRAVTVHRGVLLHDLLQLRADRGGRAAGLAVQDLRHVAVFRETSFEDTIWVDFIWVVLCRNTPFGGRYSVGTLFMETSFGGRYLGQLHLGLSLKI